MTSTLSFLRGSDFSFFSSICHRRLALSRALRRRESKPSRRGWQQICFQRAPCPRRDDRAIPLLTARARGFPFQCCGCISALLQFCLSPGGCAPPDVFSHAHTPHYERSGAAAPRALLVCRRCRLYASRTRASTASSTCATVATLALDGAGVVDVGDAVDGVGVTATGLVPAPRNVSVPMPPLAVNQ